MKFIESSHWRLWYEPDIGVQWMAAQVHHNNQWHDVMPNCLSPESASTAAGQTPHAWLPAANFHMIPYSNRIRDGQFSFNKQAIQLDHGDKHAIHGALRKLPWTVIDADDQSLVCECDTRAHTTVNWPWPMLARVEISALGHTISSRISITNHGSNDMPVGTGWHPYFVRHVGKGEPTLTLPVSGVFPDESGDCLPDGPTEPLPSALDFRQAQTLDPNQRIDCCLAELDGTCHIHWADVGIELLMEASDNCRFLVLYNPDMPHFAIEPVSNANDAFNLAAQGIDTGMQIIAPDEAFTATMNLTARLHHAPSKQG